MSCLNPLYSFKFSSDDGCEPEARVTFGPDGSLYGTTWSGGANSVGTLFKLNPPTSICRSFSCPWTETVLHNFPDPIDTAGFYPIGDLAIDTSGIIYGSTTSGGSGWPYGCYGLGCGVVYQSTRPVESGIATFYPDDYGPYQASPVTVRADGASGTQGADAREPRDGGRLRCD